MEFARGLDRAFDRLGAGIAEEHQVGERRCAQSFREPLPLRNAKQIRYMPEPLRLLAERLDEMRMGVAERVHSHAGCEIEVTLAVSCDEPSALASLEREIGARIGGQQMRSHVALTPSGVPK
jgi:hypothetical protein